MIVRLASGWLVHLVAGALMGGLAVMAALYLKDRRPPRAAPPAEPAPTAGPGDAGPA
jgi:hypothetical protein